MREDPTALRGLADQCRRLACGASTAEVADTLRSMAYGYDRRADVAEAIRHEQPAPHAPAA